MADVQKVIEIIFAGVDDLSDTLKEIGKKTSDLGDSIAKVTDPFANLTKGILEIDAALLAFGAGGLAYAIIKASEFSGAIADLNKVLSPEESAKLDQYKEEIVRLSSQFAVASTDVASSVANWKAAGFDIKNSMELTEESLKMVIAGDLEAAQATEIYVATLKGFGVNVDTAGASAKQLGDILNEVSNRYATDVKQLGIAVSELSPIAKLMGLSMQETAAFATPVIEIFRSGSEAGTALKTGFQKILDDSAPVQEALQKIGVSQKDANGQMKTGRDILFEVGAAFQKVDENQKLQIASQLFGIDQAGKMSAALTNMKTVMEITSLTAKDFGDSINKEVAIRMETSDMAIKKFGVSFDNFAIALGTKFEPAVIQIANGASAITESLRKMVSTEQFKALFDSITDFGNKLGEQLKLIAQNLPQAFADVDFSKLSESFNILRGSLSGAFTDIFDGLDLTTADGLTAAIQGIVDTIASLVATSAGIIDAFKSIGELFIDTIKFVSSLDADFLALGGSLLGIATIVNSFAGAISGIGVILQGLSFLISGPLLTAFALIGAAGIGAAIGTLINQLEIVQKAAQAVIGYFHELAGIQIGPSPEKLAEVDAAFEEARKKAIERLKQNNDTITVPIEADTTKFETAVERSQRLTQEVEEAFQKAASEPLVSDTTIKNVESFNTQLKDVSKSLNDFALSGKNQVNVDIVWDFNNQEGLNKVEEVRGTLEILEENFEKERFLKLESNTEDLKSNLSSLDDQINELLDEKETLSFSITDENNTEISEKIQDIDNELSVLTDKRRLIEIKIEGGEATGKELDDLSRERQAIIRATADENSAIKANDIIAEKVGDHLVITHTFPDEPDLEKTKEEIEKAIPPEKVLEVQTHMEVESLKSKTDILKEQLKFDAQVRIEDAKIALKELEESFDTVNVGIKDTGDVISGLFKDLTGIEDETSLAAMEIQRQIDIENARRDEQFQQQRELQEAQLEYMRLRNENMRNGEPLVNISADGLEPHLREILRALIRNIQLEGAREGLEALIGLPTPIPV